MRSITRPAPALRVARPAGAAAKATPEARADRRLLGMLLVPAIGLAALGLVMVLSASSVSAYAQYGSSFLFFKRQLLYAVVGAALLLTVSRMRYRSWAGLAVPILGVSAVLLALILIPGLGREAGGSVRWIDLGFFNLQPSEPAKVGLICFAAALLAKKWKYLGDLRHVCFPLLPVVGFMAFLVMLQPDLGTTMVMVVTVFVMLFVAGVSLKWLSVAFAAGSAIGVVLILSAGYRAARLFSWLNPSSDVQNTGYQLYQSLIGLGSGGLFGVGLGASRQKWSVLPNAHTDFIFSIIGEELGLLGALVVLSMFGVMLYAGVRIALRAPDAFGRLLAAGITAYLGFQALVNVGAVIGILPITGVPLPFISFGSSAMLANMAAAGMLCNICRTARR